MVIKCLQEHSSITEQFLVLFNGDEDLGFLSRMIVVTQTIFDIS